jgi:hypothetical protein
MLPERWRQIERLYRETLDQPPGQRTDFLAEACAGDQQLLREVESLLAQESASTAKLTDRSAWEVTAKHRGA